MPFVQIMRLKYMSKGWTEWAASVGNCMAAILKHSVHLHDKHTWECVNWPRDTHTSS